MNKEYKEKWISALRSGKYKQGYGQLCDAKNRYCCLGVLAEVILKENPSAFRKVFDKEYNAYNYGGEDLVLSNPILNIVDLADSTGHLPTEVDGHDSLTLLNDSKLYSFKQIADIIEKQF